MKSKKHSWILYFITLTVITTIAIQVYWNHKNYQENKQRVINEVQISLDNAVEEYFAQISKENFYAIVKGDEKKSDKDAMKGIWKDIFANIDTKKEKKIAKKDTASNIDFKITSLSIKTDSQKEFSDISYSFDTVLNSNKKLQENKKPKDLKVFKGKKATDSLKLIKGLETIFIAVQSDSINPKEIDSILKKQLAQKKIYIDFGLQYFKSDTLQSDLFKTPIKVFNTIESKSTFLGSDKSFKMSYSNPSLEALKRSALGIILSFILSLSVISSLFYLLNIINKQKELAEIKNDLISNITHEFKTPITTVSTALEAINHFNGINDIEKTKNYLSISENQIKKLHLMVEKLLETATLDSEKLLLKKDEVELISLLEKLTKKHQLLASNKEISFSTNVKKLYIELDEFHFENAISNLIDNAIKYGGDFIDVLVISERDIITISVSDNGKGIDKNQQQKIFDKFYRVPKGNTHDVKGFGIGLYYTKKIIQKHEGEIQLNSSSEKTVFKITLPNG
ncbi:sensor histidine kinase [Tenacibaculum geojense]|uniref:histidine kinase n=1 Tax=Tenacibaculum geojense TaxID=915352 RepID=A0ABW3JTP4_9FLAO